MSQVTTVEEAREGATNLLGERLNARKRLNSVDAVRGIVMVIMALDHVRDFFHNYPKTLNPLDPASTSTALFFTRWITHFCAPTFVFLAGTGAFLSTRRGRTKRELSLFLLTRGLWLILLELTLVRFGWFFNFDYHFVFVQVIWAIGWGMIVLAGLVFLPTRVIGAFGLLMIFLHNTLDVYRANDFGEWRGLWVVLHETNMTMPREGFLFLVAYPLVPWIGVMAAGYAFGEILTLERERRRKILFNVGLTAVALFDREREPGALLRPFVTFGRVPLFYYLLHVPLMHTVAIVFAYLKYGHFEWLYLNWTPRGLPQNEPEGYGYNLWVVYAVWLGVVAALYPLCRWFAGVKSRRRDAWLSYL